MAYAGIVILLALAGAFSETVQRREAASGRRLPIAADTAALIVAQQQRVRAAFPHRPDAELKLLPNSQRNPDGRWPIRAGNLSGQWSAGPDPVRIRAGQAAFGEPTVNAGPQVGVGAAAAGRAVSQPIS